MLIFLFFKHREPPTGFAEGRKEGESEEDRIEQKEGEKEEGRETFGSDLGLPLTVQEQTRAQASNLLGS